MVSSSAGIGGTVSAIWDGWYPPGYKVVWTRAIKCHVTVGVCFMLAFLGTAGWYGETEHMNITLNPVPAQYVTRYADFSMDDMPAKQGGKTGAGMVISATAAALHAARLSSRFYHPPPRPQCGAPVVGMLSSMLFGHSPSFVSDRSLFHHKPNRSVAVLNINPSSPKRPLLSSVQRQLLPGEEPTWKMVSGSGMNCEIVNG